MSLTLRVPISVVGLMWAELSLCAQVTELPPILTPRTPAAPIASPTQLKEGSSSRLSPRVRLLMNTASERVLADAKPIEITSPAGAADASSNPTTLLPGAGAVMLPRYVVKSTVLSWETVQRPEPPSIRPYVVEREGRPGLVNGYTFPLWVSKSGSHALNLNVIDFAGRGVDHAKDFGRVEIEFKIRF